MSDYTKGGKNKFAPYSTTHCRVPTEIKDVVDQFTALYKRIYDSPTYPTRKDLIVEVNNTIAKVGYPDSKDITRVPVRGDTWLYYPSNDDTPPRSVKVVNNFDDGTLTVYDGQFNQYIDIKRSELGRCLEDSSLLQIDLDSAIIEAKKILRHKKSAKESLAKLLSVLYGEMINKEDLV